MTPTVKGLRPCHSKLLLGGEGERRARGGRAFGESKLHHQPVTFGCRSVKRSPTSAERVQWALSPSTRCYTPHWGGLCGTSSFAPLGVEANGGHIFPVRKSGVDR